jgi:hypothetical protein
VGICADRRKQGGSGSAGFGGKQINNLIRFALEHGLTRGDDEGEMEGFQRWAKLREAA